VSIGAYVRGSDAKIDRALDSLAAVDSFLQQGRHERSSRGETLARVQKLFPASAGTKG
jgi:flagellum-specific ATP synthase